MPETKTRLDYSDMPPLIGMKLADVMKFSRACNCWLRVSQIDDRQYTLPEALFMVDRVNVKVREGIVVEEKYY